MTQAPAGQSTFKLQAFIQGEWVDASDPRLSVEIMKMQDYIMSRAAGENIDLWQWDADNP